MPFTSKDIEIFIFTRNRPEMCVQAIESVLAQKSLGDIFLLDNSTDDKTLEFIKNYPQVKYIRTQPDKPFANFITAQSLMSKPYTMVLHDDDLIHPQYLKLALEILNKEKNITYLGSRNTIFYGNNLPKEYLNPSDLKKEYYFIPNQNLFTLTFWSKPNSNWSSAIIKTGAYKRIDIKALYIKYGKVHDLVFMSQIMGTGNAAILNDKRALFYRNHAGSDSNNRATTMSEEQIINLLKLFFERSRTPDFLRKIYFLYALTIAREYYTKRYGKDFDKFMLKLLELGLITHKMILYDRRRTNILLRLRFLPKQLLYKLNFWKRYLRKIT